MSIFDDLLKESGNKFASKVSDGIDSDVDAYVDTGSYALNALLSGSIYGGLPSNKITAFAGEPSTGKCARGSEKITIYKDQIPQEITYKQLYDMYGSGDHEVPFRVTEDILVETPTGYTKINEVVCKHKNEVIRVDFESGNSFECSTNHLFSNNGVPVKAQEATEVDLRNGKDRVLKTTSIGTEHVYDISIDSPHWYISNPKHGLIHHNTWFAISVVKEFLDKNPDGAVFYFESESALTSEMLNSRGVDTDRFYMVPVVTVQEFRTQAVRILDKYLEVPEEERKPMFMVLDSLGMLSTDKEVTDIADGSDKRDMTRAQLIRGAFRVLTLKLGRSKVSMLVTNHTYNVVGCLDDSQFILMSDGTYKNITDVQVGDVVETLEGPKPVSELYQYDVDEYYEMLLEDGSTIKCTPNHKFMNSNGEWKRAVALRDGDDLSLFNRVVHFTKILSIKRVETPLKVYDFTVDDVHHYILDNGVISHNSYFPTRDMGGGEGLKYSASTIVFLSKKKEKDGTDVTGNIITATLQKSRITIENKKAQTLLDYHTGLNRYYGLLDIAEKYEIIKKVSTRYELPDGSKAFGKAINENPEKYFTEDVLKLIDEACAKEYQYGRYNNTDGDESDGELVSEED